MIEITVNGEVRPVPADATLSSWLASTGRAPETVAIERNGTIVRRAAFASTPLEAGDRLEVVQFVQGG